MHGRHIALFPLPGKPHVYGFLGLCRELVRRGYRVTLVTDEALAKFVVPAGAEPVAFEPDTLTVSLTKGLPANDPRFCEEVASIAFHYLLNSAALAVRQLDQFYKKNRPDMIIYEFAAYAGRIFSKRLHVPAIQYYPDFIHHSGYLWWEGGMGYNPKSVLGFSKLLDSTLWAYGFEETSNIWHSEDVNLCQFPTELQFDADSIDSRRYCFVGPFWGRPFRPMWKNRSGGKRVILVSAISGSSDANYFNQIIDALSGSEYHVILSVGENFPIEELLPLPTNFEINECASHLEILPHTSLHLYSGGPIGTMESLYNGVPLIAVPSMPHNYMIAHRLAEVGVALNLPLHALTGRMIRESIEAVLQDDGFLGRVKEMQSVVRSSGGSVMAVDKLEELLAGRA